MSEPPDVEASLLARRRAEWHPIAAGDELPFRHVFHGQLLGQDLAAWRADDGNVNVWENRCLHRGVRLSIGLNEGMELKCQYHGWRYANRSAGCTYIPAHPADAPARRIANRTYPAVERFGLVWAAIAPDAPLIGPLAAGDWLTLRPLPCNAPPDLVLTALLAEADPAEPVERHGSLGASLVLCGAEMPRALVFVQPVDAGRAVLRGVVAHPVGAVLPLLHGFDRRLERLRERVEEAARRHEPPAPLVADYRPVSIDLATMPALVVGRAALLRVRVARKWREGTNAVALDLQPLDGTLPTLQPGAHIDVHLPNGLVRPYSLTNGPGELLGYVVGVRREAQSRGGSAAIADDLREGDVLAISEPRNTFPLRRDATRTTLIAGGIGVTPLLAMAKALHGSRLPFDLHVFARSEEALAFRRELAVFGPALHLHLGLPREAASERLAAAIGSHGFGRQLYLCGPAPLLDAARVCAAASGWPDDAIHFEYFRNVRPVDREAAFTVELARSALTLEVPAGRTILEVIRAHGVEAPSSCEQGACGTCLATVIAGEPVHHDVYLNDSERRANRAIVTCVSRARPGSRLVLDL